MSSRFLSGAAASVTPYVPGEQPSDKRYIKLNTNESPYPPSPEVIAAIRNGNWDDLKLYPNPTSAELRGVMAEHNGLAPDRVFVGGGSDEVLGYAFIAFFNRGEPVCYPDISYGFYKVYTGLFGLDAREIPLREDFALDLDDYRDKEGGIFIANPNAPTGIALEPSRIEQMLREFPERLLVVDEAYADFAPGKSCVELAGRYDNLLVVQTFSKSRALAGMRLGMAFGSPELIEGLERVKFSFNPFNLDRVSIAAGVAAIRDEEYLRDIVGKVIRTRDRSCIRLRELGFKVLTSETNFLFVGCPGITGGEIYGRLKEQGILVRHFPGPRTDGYTRITVGTDAEMDILIEKLEKWI